MFDLAPDHPFGITALPYGIFSVGGGPRRVGVRYGGYVLDACAVARRLRWSYADLLAGPVLNPLMAAGPDVWAAVRADLRDWLVADPDPALFTPLRDVDLHLPVEVADYVDFYAAEQHAVNAGRIFRPDGPALPPNWKHLPLGYHGRAGTVVVSGTPVTRPVGQFRDPDPVFGPTRRLDFEAEVGFVVGVPTAPGERVAVADFDAHVFGVVLVNDWSARDIQRWETAPLGPFLGKSFATSISAWVLPLAALDHARVAPPARDMPVLPYLSDDARAGLDIALTVTLAGHVITRPPFGVMYWTPAQQLAHLTVNGASLRTGDLFASGTVSGPDRDQWGSLLELSWNGRDPLTLPGGERRTFLADGDEVVITATAPGPDGGRVGLGEVRGTVAPART
ncbi:fumarylacetoacetase [Luedemannella helvata]|uniref:fumarylacetoacetase n=1 Tax=Luedemannella helvata TaxID=349315 RepID=A0ABP4X8A6_9ACTN